MHWHHFQALISKWTCCTIICDVAFWLFFTKKSVVPTIKGLNGFSSQKYKHCHLSIWTPPDPPPLTKYIHGSWIVAKQYGIKLQCYWEHLREHIGNQKNQNILPLPSRKPKRKNQAPKVHVEPFHWLHENPCPKLFVTIFNLGYYPCYKLGVLVNTLWIYMWSSVHRMPMMAFAIVSLMWQHNENYLHVLTTWL